MVDNLQRQSTLVVSGQQHVYASFEEGTALRLHYRYDNYDSVTRA